MPTPVATFEPIHSAVLGSNVGSLSFASLNQGYDHLCITGGFTRNIDGDFGGRSADFVWNGVTTGYRHTTVGASNGGSIGGGGSMNGTATSSINANAGNQPAQGGRQVFETWVLNYRSTKFQKMVLSKMFGNDTAANNGGAMFVRADLLPISTALTSVTISMISETFVAGDWITIYGVKNA